MPKYQNVDEYMAGLPDERRATMGQLRSTIRAACTNAIEVIAYAMPAFRVDGRFLVSTRPSAPQHLSMERWHGRGAARR